MSTTTSKFTQPVLIGGLAMGVLSALPLINAGNVCCCLWVISGGVVAAYLFQQNQLEPITPVDGAIVGLLAGLVGAVIYFLISIPVTVLLGPLERALVDRLFQAAGSIPPEARGFMSGPIGTVVGLILSFILMLCLGAVFSTLGGVLGAAIFRKKPAQPQIIDVPPAS